VQQDIFETFIDRGQLRKLAEPTVLPNGKRIPGLKLNHPRQLALMHALVRFSHVAAQSTFTTSEIYADTLAALPRMIIASPRCATICRSFAPRGWWRESSVPGATACCAAATPSASYPETVRADLRTLDRRSLVSGIRRQQTATAEAMSTRPPLSARH
jgi:hypothetical protein